MSGQARPNATALVVLGPTGTGKSRVALEVARLLRGEIVGCDAYQVYRGLDAATGKPPPGFRRALPHHLVDHVDPRTDFSMADYVRAAEQAITAIAGRGRVPLVVGGSGLYLRGLLRGVIEAPPRDPELRARLHRIIEKGGAPRLWSWLGRRDPDTVRRLRPGDKQRLVRAIELACGDGANWSERLQQAGTWSSGQERSHEAREPRRGAPSRPHAAIPPTRVGPRSDSGSSVDSAPADPFIGARKCPLEETWLESTEHRAYVGNSGFDQRRRMQRLTAGLRADSDRARRAEGTAGLEFETGNAVR